MFRNNKELSEKYFPILERLFGFEKRIKILEVDFEKPWHKIILDQKWRLIFSISTESLMRIYLAVLPVAVGWIFTTGRYDLFYILCLGYLLVFVLILVSMYSYCILVADSMQSVLYGAVKYFLVVDPLFHSTRSSGQIIAKVNRGSETYESFLDLLVFDLVGVLVGIFSVFLVIFSFDKKSGLWAGAFLLLICLISFFNLAIATLISLPEWIKREDNLKATNVETLQQVAHIRSSFASNEQIKKIKKLMLKLSSAMASGIFSRIFSRIFSMVITRGLFAISLYVVGTQVIDSVKSGNLSTSVGLALIVSYLSSASQLIQIGKSIERLTDRIVRISDLFEFIRGFGKQTYPVLEGENDFTNTNTVV